MLPNENVNVLAIDTETHTPKLKTHGPMAIQGEDYAIGISCASPDGFVAYYPLRHMTGNGPQDIIPWLRCWLSKPGHLAIFAHAKFDIEMLWSLGIEVKCRCYDVLAIDALIDENQMDYSLDAISRRYGLGGKAREIDAWMVEHGITTPRNKKKPDMGRMREVPPDVVAPYAMQDALLTMNCFQHQLPLLKKEKLERVAKLECDLIPVTWAMRLEGVPVDLRRAEEVNLQMEVQGKAYLKQVREAHPAFEPFSARSLERYVNSFGRAPQRTPTGEPNITNDWLELTGIPELIEVANYREAEKIRRDFVSGVILETAWKGRIHPSWSSTRSSWREKDISGTRTGRLSCEHPNLAQIPRRHPTLGPLMRSLFVPRQGEVWHKADYSSQEPRISLHYAVKYGLPGAEEVAKRYYADPTVDYHQIVTDLINGVNGHRIDRGQGKTLNLALIYGLGKDQLALRLGMPREEVDNLLATYHQAVPFVAPLQRKSRSQAEEYGFITTELGRRRRFGLWEQAQYGLRSKALPMAEALIAYKYIKRSMTYKALNAAVQGTAAEQIKQAMLQLHREGLTPLITLYDELGHSISNDPKISMHICEVMENALPLRIPHHVKALMGESWDLRESK